MGLLYKPFDIVFTLIGRRLGRAIFRQVWSAIDADAPPKATTRDSSLGKIVGAGVRMFNYLIGGWPGKRAERRRTTD
jgi:hypothetical protein